MRLFLYGTLLDPNTLARPPYAGDASGMATQRQAWHLLSNVAPPLQRRGVRRMAYRVRACPRGLAVYEGPAYRLTRVVVTTANGKTASHAWIAPDSTHRVWKE
jgi:hypothetical protein